MLKNNKVPILGFAAYSGTGKTTLLCKLIARFRERGLRVGVVKHAHHTLEIDCPGKDSYELRKAGAHRMFVASRHLHALITEVESTNDPVLDDVLAELPQHDLDLILVEGFKHETFPKIEVHRPELGHPVMFSEDPTIIAVATNGPLDPPLPLPVMDLDDVNEIATFVEETLLKS